MAQHGTARQDTLSKWARHGMVLSTIGTKEKQHGIAQRARLTPLGLDDRVRRLNGPTLESNIVRFVKIHLLYTRRVSGFGRVRFGSVRVSRVDGWI